MSFIINLLSLLTISAMPLSYCAPLNSSLTTKPTAAAKEKSVEKTEVTLKQAIGIVEKRRLTDCVARTICELSCNPETYGPKGKSVYQTLKQFESDKLPKLAFYKEAKTFGQSLPKSKCNDCFQTYANCKTSTETLLRLASALTIKT